jgi:RNA polymerase sigma-70 factor, ECF subfamily
LHGLETIIPDDAILQLLLKKETQDKGFRLLLEQYQERLYWVVRRLVGSHDDANDVMQNCLIKVYRNIHSFEGKSQLYTWLYRIASNEALTFLQRQKRTRTRSANDEGHPLAAARLVADPYFDGDKAQALLYGAMETLPDKQKLVFNLRYFEEMSYEDMSKALNTSVGALKASFHHAVKKIEHILQQQS